LPSRPYFESFDKTVIIIIIIIIVVAKEIIAINMMELTEALIS